MYYITILNNHSEGDMINKLKALKKVREHIDNKILKIEQSLVDANKLELETKEYGLMTIGDLVFNKPKYVSWNNDTLFGLANEIIEEGGDPHIWIDYKLSVSETKYNALPPVLKAKFDKARSVKGGKINVKIKD